MKNCLFSPRFLKLIYFLNIYLFLRERTWAGKGQRERETENPKQAPGSQLSYRAWRRAWTHKPWDHDWAEVECLTCWTTWAPQLFGFYLEWSGKPLEGYKQSGWNDLAKVLVEFLAVLRVKDNDISKDISYSNSGYFSLFLPLWNVRYVTFTVITEIQR